MHLLHHLLTESSQKYPDRTAVVFKDKSITYSDLETKSNQLSIVLSRQGVKKGDRVGIMLNKSPEAIIALFGIMKAGAIYVPLDPLAPAARNRNIINNCGIGCLITSHEHLRKLCSGEQGALPLRKAILNGACSNQGICGGIDCIPWDVIKYIESVQFYTADLSDTAPAYILHTSGSTGIPKGVVISHLNALTFVNMAADFFSIHKDDRFASHAPLHFDLSVFDIFTAIKCGAAIVLLPEYLSTFPIKLSEFIEQENISIWNSVSSVLTMLADKGGLQRFGFESLRLVHFSGDVMPPKYLRILIKHMKKASFYNIYGQTEANSSMFFRVEEIPENGSWKIPIGKPFPNFAVFAVNDRNEVITRPGEEGELHVRSSTVALGYWRDKEKTADKFVQEPGNSLFRSAVYKTGDIVRMDDEGNYVFSGRKDHMVKSRGYRIELSEIELVLSSHSSVSQAVAIAVPDELIGNKIIAFVSPVDNHEVDVKQLMNYCGNKLPKYMLPEMIACRSSLPMTSTGKIERKHLENDAISIISESPAQ
jgi:amino acid adenylation domain-containing protein